MDDTTVTTEERPPRILLKVTITHLLVSILVDFFWVISLVGAIVMDGTVDFPIWLNVLAAAITFPAVLFIYPLLYPLFSLGNVGILVAFVLISLNSIFWGWVAARIKYRKRQR